MQTDENTSAVFLSLLAYALYVLLPLLPSVVIYKLFPKTRVTAEGEVSNWRIKAGGAFAAYVTVVLLGGPVLWRTQAIIDGMSISTWTIRIPEVVLKDRNGQVVSRRTLIKTLDVKLQPDVITKNNQIVNVMIPSRGIGLPSTTLNLSIPNFGEETIDLQSTAYQIDSNVAKRQLRFKDPVIIRQWPLETAETAMPNAPATYQKPLTPLADAGATADSSVVIATAPNSTNP